MHERIVDMEKLFYKPEHAWVGDLIPYYEDGVFYNFYLHDPRIKEGEYAEETTWHLMTTSDFVNHQYRGEAIKRGGTDRPNLNVYTGSVIKDKEGLYHAFYTAYNADYKINGKSIQSVMQAVGTSLEQLETIEEFIYTADGERYEEFDWRDPYIFWNEEESCYYMLLASRIKGAGELRGGCISLSKSKDLVHWTYEAPFYYPGMYITMECPEVFKMGEYWYLVFSTFSERFTTHYRMAKDLKGPWIIPEDDVFDTRANYAIKTYSDGNKRYAAGWIASKVHNEDFGDWEWGGAMVFHEIIQDPITGELTTKAIDSVRNFHQEIMNKRSPSFYNCTHEENADAVTITSDTLGAVLYDVPKDTFTLEIDFRVKKTHEFGIVLHGDSDMEKGYYLRVNPVCNQMAWDQWPRSRKGKYQWQIKGDVPYQIETARRLPKADEYKVLILREGDICVVYINDEVALSTRLYDHKGGKAGIYVVQGEAILSRFDIRK